MLDKEKNIFKKIDSTLKSEKDIEKKVGKSEQESEKSLEKAENPQKKIGKQLSEDELKIPASFLVSQTISEEERLKQIEYILSEGLEEIYSNMPPKKQIVFKQKGEEAAQKIIKLFVRAHIKLKKVLQIIRNWLKIIPGVNKFFLEQEAKIKTDKILGLKEYR